MTLEGGKMAKFAPIHPGEILLEDSSRWASASIGSRTILACRAASMTSFTATAQSARIPPCAYRATLACHAGSG